MSGKGGGFLDSILGIAYEEPTDEIDELEEVEGGAAAEETADEETADEDAAADGPEGAVEEAAHEAGVAPPSPATDRTTRRQPSGTAGHTEPTSAAPAYQPSTREPEARPAPDVRPASEARPAPTAPQQPSPAEPAPQEPRRADPSPQQPAPAGPAPRTSPGGRPRCPHGFARSHDGRCKRCDDEGLPPFPGPDYPETTGAAQPSPGPQSQRTPAAPSPTTDGDAGVGTDEAASRPFTIDWSGERESAVGDPDDVDISWPGQDERAPAAADARAASAQTVEQADPSSAPRATAPPLTIPSDRTSRVGLLGGLLGLLEAPLEEEVPLGQELRAEDEVSAETGATTAVEDVVVDDEVADDGAADAVGAEQIDIIRPADDDVVAEEGAEIDESAPAEPAPPPAASAPEAAPQAAPSPEGPALEHPSTHAQGTAASGAVPAAAIPPPAAADHVAAEPPPPSQHADLLDALTSFDVGRRRSALRALLDVTLDPELAAAAATSLGDPELGIRHLALEVLERTPQLAPADSVRDAIYDPDPGIRARALHLLARSRDASVIETIGERLVTESDDTVVAAGLDALASLLRMVAASDAALDSACAAVGAFDPAALPRHVRALRSLAAAFDEGDLVHRLGSGARRVRIGAAILCHASASETARQALSRLVTDDEPLVRRLAGSVGAPADEEQPTAPAPTPEHEAASPSVGEDAEPSSAVRDEVEQALLPGLVEALGDPKPEIREQAARALTALPRDRVVIWLADEADPQDPHRLALLVNAAARLELVESAASLARAAIAVEPDRMGGRLTAALRAFDAIGALVGRWAGDDDPRRRVAAVRLATLIDPADEAPTLRALEDPNAKVRIAAIEGSRSPTEGLVGEQLRVLLEHDTSPTVRQATIDAFRGARPADRLQIARIGLASPHPELRRSAVHLLRGDDIEEFNLLARALRDEDEETAEHAATVLTSRGGPETIAVLWSQLRGTGGATRQRILEVLQRVAPYALGRLASQATSSPDPTERIAGLSALATLGVDRGLERLLAALDDPATDVRLEALRAISGHPYAVPPRPVCRAVKDPEPGVRAAAVEALGMLEDDDALPDIVEALGDTEEEVTEAARRTLVTRRSPKVVGLLLPDLARPARRPRIIDVLVAMEEAATSPLLRALPRAEPAIREGILEALRASGLAERLVGDLRHPKTSRRRAALTILAVLRRPETVVPVIERLGDPDPRIRQQAARLLGELGDPRAIEPLRQAFATDLDMEVVAVIEEAYRRLTAAAREGRR